jgi:hypothetical protein
MFNDLSPLLYRPFSLPTSSLVLAFDASLEGYGVVRGRAEHKAIINAGMFRDRRRFTKTGESNALRLGAISSLLGVSSSSPSSCISPGSGEPEDKDETAAEDSENGQSRKERKKNPELV